MNSPISTLQNAAKDSNFPTILIHSENEREVFFPSGSSMMGVEVRTINRNASLAVVPGAEKRPAIAILQRNRIGEDHYCQAWFLWKDGRLFGQFHNENEMLAFAQD